MSNAISKGVPFAQAKLLTELIGRESGFRSTAKNPTSSAYGYGQFLTSTRNAYAKKYPNLNYNDPVDQIVLTWKYVQERYGTAQHALEMWEKRSPHWY
jgi:SLT domain-containing protein